MLRRRAQTIALGFTACALFSAEPASGDEPARATLAYTVEAGVERCPSERELRDTVGARLGYDPFVDRAERQAIVRIVKRGAGLSGSLEVRGPRPGRREIDSPRGDCKEIVDALATAMAISLDPASLTRPPPLPPPPAPSPSEPPAPPPPPPPAIAEAPPRDPIAETREPIHVVLALGPEVLFGELPSATGGLLASGGARWKWLGVSLEGEATLAGSSAIPLGEVSASLLTAGIVPCGYIGVAFGCLLGRIGALRGEGAGVMEPERAAEVYASLGARVGAELAVAGPVAVRAQIDAIAPLTRIALRLDAKDVWTVPSVAARGGILAVMRF